MRQWSVQQLLVFFISLFLVATAQATDIINENPLIITGTQLSPKQIPPGSNAELTVHLELAPEHHAYVGQFKVKGISPENLKLTSPSLSPVVEFFDKVSKKQKKGIKGIAQLKTVIEVPENLKQGDHIAKIQLRYQACTKDYCLFPKKLTVDIPFQTTSSLGKSTKPKTSFSFNLNFSSENWLWLFFMVFVAGVLTSFTPCIFPMIPITLAVLGSKKTGGSKLKGFLLSNSYVFGIATTYSILGLVAASTGSLFGSLLGHPAVMMGLALLFAAMSFSMMGLFEIQLPYFLSQKLNRASNSPRRGLLGAYIIGAIAGIVASPCVGPVLVSILAYVAKTQQMALGFSLLFVFALGMGQIFLILGTFGQLTQKLPKSGNWMNGVKYLFAVVMMGLALNYISPLLPPSVVFSIFIALLLGFGIIFALKQNDGPLVRGLGLLLLLNAFLFGGIAAKTGEFSFALLSGTQAKTKESTHHPEWKQFNESLLSKTLAQGHTVILDFNAEWCAACKELEAFTFSTEKVLTAAKDKKVVWMAYDATNPNDEFEKYKGRFEIMGLPTVLLFDSSGLRKDLTLTGFENADKFVHRIQKLNK